VLENKKAEGNDGEQFLGAQKRKKRAFKILRRRALRTLPGNGAGGEN